MFRHVRNVYIFYCSVCDIFWPVFVQFAMVEVAVTCIMDAFGVKVLRFFKRKELLVLTVCSVGFLFGIPHITRVNHKYVYQHVHTYGFRLSSFDDCVGRMEAVFLFC